MRISYNPGEYLDFDNLAAKEPIKQFEKWFEDARRCPAVMEANAMAVATATNDGIPSVRICLLKGFDKSGFKFFTNYESRKGQEIASNNRVSLMFFWEALMRSIRIEGIATRLSEAESTEYFHSRPRGSQIGACVSKQSSVIQSRQVLIDGFKELEEKYANESTPVEKPENWGGYLVQPYRVEFWAGQQDRLHDRIVFRKPTCAEDAADGVLTHQGEDDWVYERLSP